jgi:phospholipid/cholesterol/gamma-HCH transport system permease protein
MVPALTILGNIIGIAGGMVVGIFNLKLNMYRYISFSFDMLTWKDIWSGLVKSVVFAVIIALISCFVGLDTKGGAEGVGKSTTRSVVLSFIMIILFDCILTGIFFFSNV